MTKAMFITLEYLQCSSTYQLKAYQLCFFTETLWLFLGATFWSLKIFGHLVYSSIKTCCNSVFILYFQAFKQKWFDFFCHFEIVSVLWLQKNQLASLCETAGQCNTLMPPTNWV